MLAKSSAAKRREIVALDREIAERNKYRKEQELIINDLVDAGNLELRGLNHEILVARQELKGIKADIRTSREDKRLVEQDLEGVRNEITQLAPQFGMPSPAMG